MVNNVFKISKAAMAARSPSSSGQFDSASSACASEPASNQCLEPKSEADLRIIVTKNDYRNEQKITDFHQNIESLRKKQRKSQNKFKCLRKQLENLKKERKSTKQS